MKTLSVLIGINRHQCILVSVNSNTCWHLLEDILFSWMFDHIFHVKFLCFFFKRQWLLVSVKKNSFLRQTSFLQQCIVCWSFQSIHVLFSFQSEGSHLSHCTRLSPTVLTSSFALYFIELYSVYFYLTVITNPKFISFNAFPRCGSWTLQTSSLWATCCTRNQAGGGQPLNHRMTLSETTAHSFAVLQKHSGFTLNLAVNSTRRSAHSCYAFILWLFLLKKPLVLFSKTTDAPVLQLMGSRQDTISSKEASHIQCIPIYT